MRFGAFAGPVGAAVGAVVVGAGAAGTVVSGGALRSAPELHAATTSIVATIARTPLTGPSLADECGSGPVAG